MRKVASFDPGGTTGWCLFDEPDNFRVGCLAGEHHLALWQFLEREQPDLVIWEQFVYQRRELAHGVSLNLDAKEYIGIMKAWCKLNGVQGIEHPLAFKAFWDDKKLKSLGRYPGIPHERDALRHMLHHLTFSESNHTWMLQLKK